MKTGRNDPCPCGSGKKFKKCCLGNAPPVSLVPKAPRNSPAASPWAGTGLGRPAAFAEPDPELDLELDPETEPETASPPLSPFEQKWEAVWNEFQSQHGEARAAVFLRTLDDQELRDDETAFQMLHGLHEDGVACGERERFARMVDALADRWPEIYRKTAHYCLSWQLVDALAEGRPDVLPLTRALAAEAGSNIDSVHRGLRALAYHGRLLPLVEAHRIGWPLVRESEDVMGWAIGEFAEAGAAYEMYAYLEDAASPDPSDGELLERIRFFIEQPRLEFVADFIGDVSGAADRPWTVADFTLRPPGKPRSRDDWNDDDDDTPVDPGSQNLFRLISQFVGYLRRVEQCPFPRGELIRHDLHRYFIDRHRGDLAPRLGMVDQMLNPRKKLPRPPKPSHPLCPERVTFEACLGQMFGFLSEQHHQAAALFEVVPAWLRFLLSKNLISEGQRVRTLEELRPLHADLLKLMETYKEDTTLHRSLKEWPGRP